MNARASSLGTVLVLTLNIAMLCVANATSSATELNSAPNPNPVVANHGINDGAAQRSMVTNLFLVFSQDVSASLTVSNLVLWNLTAPTQIDPTNFKVAYDPASQRASWTFPGLPGQSLPDGNYVATLLSSMTTNAAGNHLDGNSDGRDGDNYAFLLFRLFGDANGDRQVGADDEVAFQQTLNRNAGDPFFDPRFDVNADGVIDQTDLDAFSPNHLKSQPLQPAIVTHLVDDTGASAFDRITCDPTVAGRLLLPNPWPPFRASFDLVSKAVDISAELDHEGFFWLDTTRLAQINGGPLSDGQHTLHLWAGDRGHPRASHDLVFVLDTAEPDTAITSHPPDPSSASSATFAFDGSDNLTPPDQLRFECSLDAQGWKPCISPVTFTGLALGQHHAEFRAIDLAGKHDSIPAIYYWTVTSSSDNVPPDTAIGSGPPNLSNSSTAAFAFTGTDDVTSPGQLSFECRLDNGNFAPCTSPQSITSLADGSHTFEVRAIDASGNIDPTPATFTWRVDTTPPDTRFTSTPPVLDRYRLATFTFTGSDNVTAPANLSFECRFDSGTFAPCFSSQSFDQLPDGPHTFKVRSIDAAGNVDPTPASFTWTVDATPPDTSIITKPPSPSNSGSATFTFTGTDNFTPTANLSFECRLDGGNFTPCTSPQSFNNLVNGPHTFEVRAIDAAGNADTTPASYTWLVGVVGDMTPPDTAITSHPPNLSNSSSATFAFTGIDDVTPPVQLAFESRLDNAAFAPCTSPQSLTVLAEGSHTFEVRAIDAAGNADTTPASFTWTVDTTPPDTSITTKPPSLSNSASATFAFIGMDNLTPPANLAFECRLDNAPFALCTSPQPFAALPDGLHTFEVRAIDAAGNVDSTSASFTWTVDTTRPSLTLNLDPAFDSPPVGDSQTTNTPVTLIGQTEPGLVVTLNPGGATVIADSAGNFNFPSIPLFPGANSFTAQTTDAAGNQTNVQRVITLITGGAPCLFDPALTGWTINVGQASRLATNPIAGTVIAVNCEAVMTEGDSFIVTLERTFQVPANPTTLSFTFSKLTFDTTASNLIRDAFEAALVDANGKSPVFTIQSSAGVPPAGAAGILPANSYDAFFNQSDAQPAALAAGVTFDGQLSTITLDISKLPPGTAATLIFRLVNNDLDNATSVHITDVHLDASTPLNFIPGRARLLPSPDQIPAALPATQFPIATNITVPPGFIAEIFATVTNANGLAFAPVGSPFSPDLYVASFYIGQTITNDLIYRISPTGSVSLFATLLPEADEGPMRFPPLGSPYGDFLYVSSNNRDNGCPGDCGGTIQRIDQFGNVFDFTAVGIPNGGLGEPAGIAFGPLAGFGGELYVANSFDVPADVIRVDASGGLHNFIDDGNIFSGLFSGDVDFSPGGAWGNVGYFLEYVQSGQGCYCLHRFDTNGVYTPSLLTFQDNANSLRFARGGSFGTDLYFTVTGPAGGYIVTMKPDGTTNIFASGFTFSSSNGYSSLEFSLDGSAIYVADYGANRIYRISSGLPTISISSPQDQERFTSGAPVLSSGLATAHGSVLVTNLQNAAVWDTGPNHNNHSYQVFAAPGGIDWSDAEAVAVSLGGNLASLTSAEENAFVFSLVSSNPQFWVIESATGSGIGPWLGGTQSPNSPEPAGGWQWSDGEAFTYTNWAAGEPTDGVGSPGNAGLGIEDRIHLFGSRTSTGSKWNDYPNSPQNPQVKPIAYIVEMDRPHVESVPNRITLVTVNNRPVDVLDPAGNFFALVNIGANQNNFLFTATDSLGQTASTSLTLFGTQTLPGQIDFTQLLDISAGVQGDYRVTSFNERNLTLYAELAVRNVGQFPIKAPLLVGIDHISDPAVRVLNADGVTPGGIPYNNFSSLVSTGDLQPSALTGGRAISFFNPNGTEFTYELVVLGQLNRAPAFISTPAIEAIVGVPYIYDADATDADNDTLTYALTLAPSNLTIDPVSGLISFTPTATDLGTHNVTVSVDDGHGGSALQNFVLTVINPPPNRPPFFTSTPVVDAQVGVPYDYDADAIDPDADPIAYSLKLGPLGMTINPINGVVHWTPLPAKVGTNLLSVSGFLIDEYAKVADPVHLAFAPDGTLYVGRDNTGSGGGSFDPVKIHRISIGGSPVTDYGNASISDPDAVAVDALGIISGTPGAVLVGGEGSGGGLISAVLPDQEVIQLFGPAPSIQNPQKLSVDHLGRLLFPVNDDSNNGFIMVSTGAFPTPLFTSVAQYGAIAIDPNDRIFSVIVTNGEHRIQVNNPDGTLAIASFIADPNFQLVAPDIQFAKGGSWGKGLYAIDDGRLISFDSSGTPTILITRLPLSTNIVAFTFGPDGNLYVSDFDADRILRVSSSQVAVSIGASDGRGGTATQSFVVTVLPDPSNHPPVIISLPVTTAAVGQNYTYDVDTIDADNDALTYSFLTSPPGMVIDSLTGLIQWSPTSTQLGPNQVSVQVTDGRGGFNTQSFTVVVSPPSDLTIGSIDKTGLVYDGQALTVSGNVTAVITNLGPGAASAPFDVMFFEDRNLNGAYDIGIDSVLGTVTITSTLDPGQSRMVTAQLSGFVLFPGNVVWGFVDSSNTVFETTESNNLGNSAVLCETQPIVGQFNPVLKFHALQGLNVNATPMVVNLTDDNHDGKIDINDTPDIVFATEPFGQFGGGPIKAISGDDGHLIFSAGDPNLVASYGEIAVGDIDGDGLPDIVAAHSNGRNLIAFDHTGQMKWISTTRTLPGRSDSGGAIAIANLDGVGLPEIIVGASVYSADGTLLADGRDLGGTIGFNLFTAISIVADIDLDGLPEIIAGPTAYSFSNGALRVLWQRTDLPDGFCAVGNFDADPFPEIVLVGNGQVFMLNHDGSDALNWHGPVSLPGGGPGGPPTIADLDGDGIPEIGVAGRSRYTVFNSDGTVRWTSPTSDFSSGTTGSTTFDFEGDGKSEVVYRDEQFLRIFRGTDGTILFQYPVQSNTGTEYPVVADVNNDGNAEIVITQEGGTGGVLVFGDLNDTWVSTRRIWNQHTYHINNVNEDGTIPLQEQPSWLTHNTYRLNAQPTRGESLLAPDLIACFLRLSSTGSQTTIIARVGNGGALHVLPGINVAFYNGNPSAGGSLLGVVQTATRIVPGAFEEVSLTVANVTVSDVWVAADDDGTGKGSVNECNEANNLFHIPSGPIGTAEIHGPIFNDLNGNGIQDARHLLVTSLGTDNVLRYDAVTGAFLGVFAADNGLTFPDGLTYGPDGNLYLVSQGDNSVRRFDGNTGTFIDVFVQTGSGGLSVPHGLTFGCDGNLYVNSHALGKVLRYDGKTGAFLGVFASGGGLQNPTDSVFGPDGNFYVCGDFPGGGGVNRYDGTTGAFLNTFVQAGSGGLSGTHALVFGPDGNLYMASRFTDEILRYHGRTGVFIDAFVSARSGGLSQPTAMVFGFDGKLYVSSFNNDSVLRYDAKTGTFLDTFISSGSGGLDSPDFFTFSPEPVLVDWLVYIDQNQNGKRDPGELFTTTASCDGTFAFKNLASGTYTVAEELQPGWIQTAPSTGTYTVTLVTGQILTGIDFGNQQNTSQPGNHSPVFTSVAPSAAIAGQLLRYNATASDPDGDALTFDLAAGPSGMTVQSSTGILVWVPTPAQVGNNNVVLRVQDGRGGVALQSFQVLVAGQNTSPFITSTPRGSAIVGLPWQYQATAQDADGDPITFSIVTVPTGMTINPTTGLITWTPTAADLAVQPIPVAVSASDNKGGADTQSFNLPIVASAGNRPPSITSTPPGAVRLGSTYRYQVVATDPDSDPLIYSLPGPPTPPTGMTIDAAGLVTWTPTTAQFGANQVQVRVDDGRGGFATQTFTVNVVSQNPNHPPNITSTPSFNAILGVLYSYNAQATDPDSDVLGWSLDTAPSGMSIDPNLGTVRWTPGSAQLGPQSVVVRASDPNGGFATQSFTVTVHGANLPPVITSTPATIAAVNTPSTYFAHANDPEGGALAFALTQFPSGMTIDSTTGAVQWTPTAAQLGTNDVTIQVTDLLGATATQIYQVVVASHAQNNPPVITSTPSFAAIINRPYQYAVTATDPDGDSLSFLVLANPSGMTINAASGVVDWTPTAAQLGVNSVTVAAVDPFGSGGTQTFTITVFAANNPPQITSHAPQTVLAGQSYRYDVIATDADGDPLTYSLTGPPGMAIDNLGRVTWSPTVADAGIHTINITVADIHGDSQTETYDLQVISDTQAPTVHIVGPGAPLPVGAILDVNAFATDNIGVTSLNVTIAGVAVPLDAAGHASVVLNAVGTFPVVATATDAAGNVGHDSFTLVVFQPGGGGGSAPIVAIAAPIDDAVITALTNVVGTADDPNLLSWKLEVLPFAGGAATQIASGTTPVVNNVLGQFDPSTLANDTYILRLTAFSASGLSSSIDVTVHVAGDLKIGNFRLSFTDLSIPVNGIPITVGRTYDSLTAGSSTDFGFGWRLEFRNTALRTSVPLNGAEQFGSFTPFRQGSRVYVTVPGGRREGFTFNPRLRGGFAGFFGFHDPVFDPDPGVTSQLKVPNVTIIQVNNGTALPDFYTLSDLAFNPADDLNFPGGYTLTTKDGTAYQIDGVTGELNVVADPNANTLTFTDTDITSSSGPKVTFARDPQGRITSVTDPMGQQVKYQYDSNGDLVSVTDRAGNVTQFAYDPTHPHFLQKVIDPLGRTGVRSDYDAQGRLTTLTDANGNTVQLTHNPNASIEQVTDALGHTTSFEYDDRGNVITELNSLNGTTTRTYDGNNFMTSETDPLLNATFFTYDGSGNVLMRTDPLGNVTQNTYATFSPGGLFNLNRATFTRLQSTIDPLGNATLNSYSSSGNILATTDAAGHVTSYTYDGAGNQTSIKDAAGNTTQFAYDGVGRLLTQTDAASHATTFAYDGNGNQTNQTTTITSNGVPVIVTTSTAYDANGRPTAVTDAAGKVTQTKYDALGKQSATIDALGNQTDFVYDNASQLVQTKFADGTSTSTAYDAAGHRTNSTDRAGRTTQFQYDALGRLTTTVYPDGTQTTTVYDLAGRVTTQFNESDQPTDFAYDQAGRQIAVTNALGAVTRSTYDQAGRKIADTDARGHVTQYAYDALGRRVQTIFADNTSKSTGYDTLGRVSQETDQAGVKTAFGYDTLGRLTSVTNAFGAPEQTVTTYAYNEAGSIVMQTDANGHVTSYDYDGLGRRVATTLPLNQKSSVVYDAVGNVASATDFNGKTIQFQFDVNHRLTAKLFPDGTSIQFAYTATGRRKTILDVHGTTSFLYDKRDRLLSRTDPDNREVRYTYDAAGNRTSITTIDPAGNPVNTTHYSFDQLNRLASVTDPNGHATTYNYDAANNVTTIQLPNHTTRANAYDTLNRLTRITHTGPGGVIADFQYTLAPTGNRTKVVENPSRTVQYAYDPLNRLTGESITDAVNGNRTIQYALDNVGNRLTRADSAEGTTAYTYDNNDELRTEALAGVTTTYTYDANGNTLSRGNITESATYTWDLENRLVSVDVTDANGPRQIVNAYDANGIRLAQRVIIANNTNDTTFLIDANRPFAQVLEEWTSLNFQPWTLSVAHTYGPHAPISQNRSGGISYYQGDHLNTTRVLTDANGTPTDGYNYDAFGRILQQTGTTPNNYLYTGEQRDPNLKLDYLRSRHLNFNAGRFYGRDALQVRPMNPSTLHRYCYVGHNSINRIDPSGLIGIDEIADPARQYFSSFGSGFLGFLTRGLPDAVGFGIGYAPPSLSSGAFGTGPIAGAEVVFAPRLRQWALFGFGGIETSAEFPTGIEDLASAIEGEYFVFEAWYWNLKSLAGDPELFTLGGLSTRGLYSAVDVTSSGTVGVLFGVSNKEAVESFAIVGSSFRLFGPQTLSEGQMLAATGTLQFLTSALITSSATFTGFQGAAASIVAGGATILWVDLTYGQSK